MIRQRPAGAAARTLPGHWEGDLITGTSSRSAIGTLVDRASRFTILVHLPGRRHTAGAVRDALVQAMAVLPAELRRSLTWDQGKELALHAEIAQTPGLPVLFCDPHSPWQRPASENTNGLLRQYFPKGSDLRVHSQQAGRGRRGTQRPAAQDPRSRPGPITEGESKHLTSGSRAMLLCLSRGTG
jgi:IS30 family transposase